MAAGEWWDRECLPYTVCSLWEYEVVQSSTTSDRICELLTVCASDEFESSPGDATHDRVCAPVRPECDPEYEYESKPAGPTNDRVCSPITVCGAGKYLSVPHTATTDGECTQCTAGRFKATYGNDAVCEPCQPGQHQGAEGTTSCVVFQTRNPYKSIVLHF